MKKLCWILALGLFLGGCGAEETYETIADEAVVLTVAEPREMLFTLPEESVLPAMETDDGTLYMCRGYDVTAQTLTGGDLDGTLRSVSGFGRDELTLLETEGESFRRYEFAWVSSGDEGETVCRAAVLDDGSYHYVLTAAAPAEDAGEYREMWSGMFESFTLG